MQQTTAPDSLWHAVWPAIQPLITPSTLGAMAATIFITHAIKSLAYSLSHVDKDRDSWVAFCTITSIIVGLFVGLGFWIAGASPVLILITTFGSGPVWRLAQALLPAKIADTLLTEPDRRFRNNTKETS